MMLANSGGLCRHPDALVRAILTQKTGNGDDNVIVLALAERLALLLASADYREYVAVDPNLFAQRIHSTEHVFFNVSANDGQLRRCVHVGLSNEAAGGQIEIRDARHRRRPAAHADISHRLLTVTHMTVEVGDTCSDRYA